MISLNLKFLLSLVGLFLFTFIVFQGVLGNGFVLNWDDFEYVTENRLIQKGTNFFEMLTAFHSANWHPLTWFSHSLDYRLYGLNPWGHHLTSLVLHGLNTCWVFVLFIILVGKGQKSLNYGVVRFTKDLLMGNSYYGLMSSHYYNKNIFHSSLYILLVLKPVQMTLHFLN